ncbi:hypothetical protein ACFX5D_08230 [Flavobacterium sp. LB3P45]|uniref:LTXXQ motif family protein n=1 Tax=Flavobacterium fructosi TaxID=3230416 RepID=A0ABW6HMM4_9FLAO
MKKLIIATLLVVGMTSFAQDKKEMGRHHRGEMEKFTPEQQNQLMLKKMTLELDLNASQQKEMSKIISEKSAKREARIKEIKANEDSSTKPTSDEMFARKNRMLDEQIAMKERMKKILNPEQFKKWEDMKGKRHHGMKNRMMRHNDGKPANMDDKK